MSKPRSSIVRGDGLEGVSKRIEERITGATTERAEDRFYLGKSLFDRIAIGRIGRQKQQGTTAGGQRLVNMGCFVDTQVVQHHHLARMQGRDEHLGHIHLECCGIHCPFHRPGATMPCAVRAAMKVRFLP